ncbi:MAG: trypsin-like peptidase domain-containing protein [Anaerolineae bacterium]|nr:trypsin-like peptidase domain-containing protein [Anaerolineae bacterium]
MSDMLKSLSAALCSTVETVGQSVVQVNARRRLPASGIVWSADGVIVTAHHVVQRDDNITVGLADGQSVAATLVGRDPTTDVAVLRVAGQALTPPTWAAFAGQDVKVGHLALALGRPGQTVQATLGIVSALGESWRTPAGGQVDHYLQSDVVMYPGFSGGPLVSATGEVLGISSSALLRGVSLAVPTPTVWRVVETLLSHGKVRRGYLGVSTQPVRLPAALQTEVGQETGLLLVAVEPDSPAEQAGLLLGDTIVALDGHTVRQHDDLLTSLGADRVGATVSVKIVRSGQVQTVNLVIGERD